MVSNIKEYLFKRDTLKEFVIPAKAGIQLFRMNSTTGYRLVPV